MNAAAMPSLDELNRCGRDAFVAALGPIFEHSPWIAEETFGRRPFASAERLREELCATLRGAPVERQVELIRAHPDLAGRLAREGRLTAASAREQASAGLDRLAGPERAELESLNAAYRARFEWPFVICARLNAREAIVAALRARMANSPDEERRVALAQVEKIAELRLADAIDS